MKNQLLVTCVSHASSIDILTLKQSFQDTKAWMFLMNDMVTNTA